MKKKLIVQWSRNIAIVMGLSIGFGLFFAFLFGGFELFQWSRLIGSSVYSMAIGVIAWAGNSLVTIGVGRRWPWNVSPGRTFAFAMIFCVAYTLISIGIFHFLVYFPWKAAEVNWPLLMEVVLVRTLIALIITVIILLLVFLRIFLRNWREGLIRMEQYKRDIITAQYDSLRNQVNPHFLFNSLSVLTSLVETDQQTAVKFIRKLGDVYRYVLDMQGRELVTLGDELALVRSYVFLQQYRFEGQLKVTISDVNQAGKIVPLALQMLLENAVKHNITSEAHPLTIDVFEEDGFVVCRNNYQPRAVVEASSGTGLKNIAGRFAMFTTQTVVAGVENNFFVVRIPILLNHENPDC